MSYGQGQGTVYTPPPRVRLDVIGPAWKLFQEQMGTWIGAVLISGIPTAIVVGGYYIAIFAAVLGGGGRGGSQDIPLGLNLLAYPISIVLMGIQYFFMAGLCNMALKQLRGHAISISDLFSSRAGAGAAIVSGLLMGLGILFGTYACLIPGLLLSGLWMLTAPILADKQLSGTDAMRLSFSTLKPDMWNALGVMFVLQLVASLGGIACGVGALFTYPLLPISLAILYREFFPDDEPREQRPSGAPTILGGER